MKGQRFQDQLVDVGRTDVVAVGSPRELEILVGHPFQAVYLAINRPNHALGFLTLASHMELIGEPIHLVAQHVSEVLHSSRTQGLR